MNQTSTRLASPLIQLLRTMVWGALATSLVVGLLLAAQRVLGGATHTPDPLTAVILVAFAATAACLLRQRWENTLGSSAWERGGLLLLPAFCLLLLGIAVTSPDLPLAGLVIVWLVIVAEEGFALWRQRGFLQEVGRRWRRSPAQGSGSQQTSIWPPATVDGTQEALPEEAMQSIVRTRDAEGVEAVSGTLRAEFRPGERTVYVHIGFCPQLAGTPSIEFEQTDGPDASIKLAQVLPHGARFDIRLQRASSEEERVELAFHAVVAD